MTTQDDNKNLVLSFFKRWEKSAEELAASLNDFIGENCVWKQCGLPDLTGPKEAVDFMAGWGAEYGMDTVRVDIVSLVADGDIVVSERVDIIKRSDGSVIGEAPVVGVMEIENGKLRRWTEYFDPGAFQSSDA